MKKNIFSIMLVMLMVASLMIFATGCDSGNSDKFYHWGALLCAIALADAGYIKDFGLPLEE